MSRAAAVTLTGTLNAWLSKHHEIAGLFDEGVNAEQIVAAALLTRDGPTPEGEQPCYWEREGYTHIGTAEVTITIPARDTVIENKVSSLRAQKSAVLAEAQRTATDIEQQIQKLLAISYDAEVQP